MTELNSVGLQRSIDLFFLKHSLCYSVNETSHATDFNDVDFNEPLNILILGDSVNRFMIFSWCDFEPSQWGHEFGNYGNSHATYTCQRKNIRLSQLHIYGHQMHAPPYFLGHVKKQSDPFCETIDRVPKALATYIPLYGTPTHVIYRTEMWDTQYYHSTFPGSDDEIRKRISNISIEYINNHEWVVNFIRNSLPCSYIGTHSIPTPKSPAAETYFPYLLKMQRYLALKENLFLMDWHAMLSTNLRRDYLRDFIHPTAQYCLDFTMGMISSFQKFEKSAITTSGTNKSQGCNSFSFRTIMGVLAEGDHIYLIYFGIKRQIPSINVSKFLEESHPKLELPIEDIVKLMNLPEGKVISSHLVQGAKVQPIGTKQVYYLDGGKKHPVSSGKVFTDRNWEYSDIKRLSVEESDGFDIIPTGIDI